MLPPAEGGLFIILTLTANLNAVINKWDIV